MEGTRKIENVTFLENALADSDVKIFVVNINETI